FSQVADVAGFLNGLDPDERRVRLDVLRQLDEKSSDGSAITMTLGTSSGLVQSSHIDSSFQIRPAPDYLEIVRLPFDRLRLALRTGSTKTKKEQAEERLVWDRDVTLVNSLRADEEYKASSDALRRAKDDPEAVVRLVAPYVEKLLEHGTGMVFVEHLGV